VIITPTQPSPIRVTSRTGPIPVVTTPIRPVNVTVPTGKPGPPGPPGEDAQWARMTRAEFDALPVKDPNTLYVIIG
jgi:hypothetical protein